MWQSRGLPLQEREEQLHATLEIQARNRFKAHARYDILSARHKPT
jgi:hypothetical protein